MEIIKKSFVFTNDETEILIEALAMAKDHWKNLSQMLSSEINKEKSNEAKWLLEELMSANEPVKTTAK